MRSKSTHFNEKNNKGLNMKKKQITAAVLAAAILLSGCDNAQTSDTADTADTSGTTVTEAPKREFSPAAVEIADEYFKGDRHSYAAWADIDDSTVIGSVDIPEHIPDFDITFGEFIDEYMYYLITMGIEDDMAEDKKDQCESYRTGIINYLAFEKMYLYAAKLDYGITPETLTQEQLDTIKKNADGVKDDWADTFYVSAREKLGGDATNEEVDALCREVIDVLFDKCGIDYDIFSQWETHEMIYQLALDALLNDTPISDEDVKAQIDTLTQSAKEAAANSPGEYESVPTYALAYVPKGTRKARHILLSFPEETVTAINDAMEKDDTDAANEAIKAALDNGLTDTAEEVIRRINDGEDFDKLLEEYSGMGEHIVLKNSELYAGPYVDRVYSVEEPNGTAPIFYDRSGVYIIQYTGEAEVTDDDRKQLEELMREYLKNAAQQNVQATSYELWTKDVDYSVNCELLKINESDLISYGKTETPSDVEITE